MRRIVIVGAGGHGRVVADAVMDLQSANVCFLDDLYPGLTQVDGHSVIGSADALRQRDAWGDDDGFVVAIGSAQKRLALVEQVRVSGLRLVSVVHPRATVSRKAELGAGSMILAGACVNIGARLGLGVIVNTGATVDHDCILEDGVHICPGAHLGGDVRVGRASWVGIGASVKHGVQIGRDVLIGAGAAVVSNIESGAKAVGVPARVVRVDNH